MGVQAVLAACDLGEVRVGDQVIAITGDTASVVSASTTEKFLSKQGGLIINEILCKPRNLTLSRAKTPKVLDAAVRPFDEKALPKVVNVKALADKSTRKLP